MRGPALASERKPQPAATGERPVAVLAAIAANLVIAAAKFLGAYASGSSAMLSEGIHSVVDTLNGTLILYGRKRASLPPDEDHAFGYGKELYFWTLIVAILIFALGGGMSIYEGIVHLRHPRAPEHSVWNTLALGVAFVCESTSLVIAYRSFKRTSPDPELWPAIHRSKDPSLFTVLFEDSAAVIGIVIAAASLFLGEYFGNRYLDGIASILIGLLLGVTATFLARESKGLLIGEAVAPETRREIRRMVSAHPAVKLVGNILTMYVGAENVLLVVEVSFRPELRGADISRAARELERQVRDRFPRIKRLSIGLVPETAVIRPPESGTVLAKLARE